MLDLVAEGPVAGLEGADEVEGETGGAAVAGEGGFHGGGEGEGFEDALERGFEENVEERDEAEEAELGRVGGEGGGEELAELGAGESHGKEGGGALGGEGSGHGDGDQLAEGVFADHEEGFAEGGDGAGMALEGGVGEAEDAIAEGSVGGEKLFDFAEVGGVAVELGEKPEVDEGVLGNGMRGDEDRLGEEVALKERAAFGNGDAVLDVGFDFFGEEAGGRTGEHGIRLAAELEAGGLEVDFDEVGEVEEGETGRVGVEAVEGEAIALLAEGQTGGKDIGIGVDVFEDFKDGGRGGKEGDKAFGKGGAGAVDEGGVVGRVGDEQEPVIDDFAGGEVGVAGKAIGFTGAVEELVAEEAAVGVEDGLAAEETAGGGDRGMGRGSGGGIRGPGRGDGGHGYSGSPRRDAGRATQFGYRPECRWDEAVGGDQRWRVVEAQRTDGAAFDTLAGVLMGQGRTTHQLRKFRFGRPQRIAAVLLLMLLGQCLWVSARQQLTETDYQFARCGREMWERPSPLAGYFTTCGNIHDGTLAYRAAGLPLTLERILAGQARTESTWEMRREVGEVKLLLRLPFMLTGLALGACLWWVTRRLFGNAGGYIALALYCFMPAVVRASTVPNNEILAAFGVFSTIYLGVGVGHALQGPPRKWRPRIVLLTMALGFTAAAHLAAFIVALLFTVVYMAWVGEGRRAYIPTLLIVWVVGAFFLLFASYDFRPDAFSYVFRSADGRMWLSLEGAEWFFRNPANAAFTMALLGSALLYAASRRSRYFGNTAPLLVGLFLLVLVTTGVQSQPWLWGLPFLIAFVGGIFADALETRGRRAFLWATGVVLAAQAGLCVASLWGVAAHAGLAVPAAAGLVLRVSGLGAMP